MGVCASKSNKTAPAPQPKEDGARAEVLEQDGAVTVLPAGAVRPPASPSGGPRARREVTVVAVGLDNAGKSTVVNNLAGEADAYVMPTMGFDLDCVRRRHFDAKVYGLGGGASIRGYWGNYFDEVHAVLFVVDAADAARVDEAAAALREVRAAARVGGKPLLVYANKQDLPEALTAAELAARLGLLDAGFGDSPVHVRQCVALCDPDAEDPRAREADAGVGEAFDWLLDAVEADYEALSERVARDVQERRAREKERMAEQKARVAEYRRQEEEEEEKAAAAADKGGLPGDGGGEEGAKEDQERAQVIAAESVAQPPSARENCDGNSRDAAQAVVDGAVLPNAVPPE